MIGSFLKRANTGTRTEKLSQMLHSIVMSSDEKDAMNDILTLYCNMAPETEASLACFTYNNRPELIGSSTADEDHYLALQKELARLCDGICDTKLDTIRHLDIGNRIARYEHVENTKAILLHGEKEVYGILILEEYAGAKQKTEGMEPFYELFTLFVRSYVLMRNNHVALKLDETTKLFGHDALMEKLEKLVRDLDFQSGERLTLAIFQIDDMAMLSLTSDYTDVVSGIAQRLQDTAPYVYRISTSRFACIYPKDYVDAGLEIASLTEELNRMKEVCASAIYTVVKESSTAAIMACNKRLSDIPEGKAEFVHNDGDGLYSYAGEGEIDGNYQFDDFVPQKEGLQAEEDVSLTSSEETEEEPEKEIEKKEHNIEHVMSEEQTGYMKEEKADSIRDASVGEEQPGANESIETGETSMEQTITEKEETIPVNDIEATDEMDASFFSDLPDFM